MLFERRFKIKINIKKIKRIKRKFGLETRVRRRNKYRAVFKAGEEHTTAPNIVQRNFSPLEDVNVLSADITELNYMGGKKAYLFGVKELKSRMLVHHDVRESPTIDLVIGGFSEFLRKLPRDLKRKTIIHSDQGFQFTSLQFRSVVDANEILQSMSRKGNCLDNAPIESFFGHLKDEIDYKKCSSFKEIKAMVKEYVSYYNFDRPQWSMKRKTPAEAGVELGLVF
jgi:transposase InsO family protein